MYNISYKHKGIILALFKIGIILSAFYFMYSKLVSNELLSFNQFQQQLSFLLSKNSWLLLLVLLLTDANWILEVFKWKTLASNEKKISFMSSFEQCLGSLTASIITPNRIGEYGAKALYFEKDKRKKIMLLNLIGNLSQLLMTLIFGVAGILILISKFYIPYPKFNFLNFVITLVILSVLYLFRRKLQLSKIKNYLKEIQHKVYYKVLTFSFLRYLLFSHQFYLLTLLFGIEVGYLTTISLILSMYLLASIIPSMAIFDWIIKGSIAVFLFSLINVNGLVILSITSVMWLLNFAIPAILGSFFVFNFKLIDRK